MSDQGGNGSPFDVDDIDPLIYADAQEAVELRRDWRADMPVTTPSRQAPGRRPRKGVPAWTPDVPVPEVNGSAGAGWPVVAAAGVAGVVVFALWMFLLVRSWIT